MGHGGEPPKDVIRPGIRCGAIRCGERCDSLRSSAPYGHPTKAANSRSGDSTEIAERLPFPSAADEHRDYVPIRPKGVRQGLPIGARDVPSFTLKAGHPGHHSGVQCSRRPADGWRVRINHIGYTFIVKYRADFSFIVRISNPPSRIGPKYRSQIPSTWPQPTDRMTAAPGNR
jgi:hypothetical protein